MNRRKLLSGSFWLIMLIHLTVFTAIGFLTGRWLLLLTFLGLLAATLALARLGVFLAKRYREGRKPAGNSGKH
ncbi:MAG: hypothetical protein LBP25_05210 [Tannerellaceae bacterium]|jgi:hypothetical protein|nr:hypothetical protein [Tannerellaceae bacterium]